MGNKTEWRSWMEKLKRKKKQNFRSWSSRLVVLGHLSFMPKPVRYALASLSMQQYLLPARTSMLPLYQHQSKFPRTGQHQSGTLLQAPVLTSPVPLYQPSAPNFLDRLCYWSAKFFCKLFMLLFNWFISLGIHYEQAVVLSFCRMKIK